MPFERCRLTGVLVQLRRVESAVLQQFNSGKRRTKTNAKRFPVPRLVEGCGHASRRMAQKGNDGHAGEQATLPEDQIRMQVTDDRLFQLSDPAANHFLAPEIR